MPEFRLVITCDCPSVGVGGRSFASGDGNRDVGRSVSGNCAVGLIFDLRPSNAVPVVAVRSDAVSLLTAPVRTNSHFLRLPILLFCGHHHLALIAQASTFGWAGYGAAPGGNLFAPRQSQRVADALAISTPTYTAPSVVSTICELEFAALIGSEREREDLVKGDEMCPYCGEAMELSDDVVRANLEQSFHRECIVRMIAGSVGHQRRQCLCYGGRRNGEPKGVTKREGAKMALAEFRRQARLRHGDSA